MHQMQHFNKIVNYIYQKSYESMVGVEECDWRTQFWERTIQ
jgi:hypothetical protein